MLLLFECITLRLLSLKLKFLLICFITGESSILLLLLLLRNKLRFVCELFDLCLVSVLFFELTTLLLDFVNPFLLLFKFISNFDFVL